MDALDRRKEQCITKCKLYLKQLYNVSSAEALNMINQVETDKIFSIYEYEDLLCEAVKRKPILDGIRGRIESSMENNENKVEMSMPIMKTGDQPDRNKRIWPTEVVHDAIDKHLEEKGINDPAYREAIISNMIPDNTVPGAPINITAEDVDRHMKEEGDVVFAERPDNLKEEVVEEKLSEVSGMSNTEEYDVEAKSAREEKIRQKDIQKAVSDAKQLRETVVQLAEEAVEDMKEETDKLFSEASENEEVTEDQLKQMGAVIRNIGDMMKIMDETWKSTKKEYKVNEEQMKELEVFNNNHMRELPDYPPEDEEASIIIEVEESRKLMAEGLNKPYKPLDKNSDEFKEAVVKKFKEKWEGVYGLRNIPEEEISRIFGEDHTIFGVEYHQTRDRVVTVFGDYANWIAARREYNDITLAYNQLIYIKENQEMEKLRLIMEQEPDETKKAQMANSLKMYEDMKYLGFMTEPIGKKDFDILVKAYADSKKIEYWLNRSREKLKQLKMSSQVILEISQFEKRYLPEKYHTCNNFILLYFMKMIVYANIGNPKDSERRLATAMIMAIDGVIRNIYDEEGKQKVINNLQLFLDQFVETIRNVYPEEERPGYKKEETDKKEEDN